MAEIAEQAAAALMDEEQLVAVAVAHETVHLPLGAPLAEAQMRVRQHRVGLPRRGGDGVDLGEVEGARTQRSLPARPAGRRMSVVELGRGAEEPLLPHLALIGAGRQIGMSLARGDALDAREGDAVLHISISSERLFVEAGLFRTAVRRQGCPYKSIAN